jgi:Spy/CpxP family protein refolding chaperone
MMGLGLVAALATPALAQDLEGRGHGRRGAFGRLAPGAAGLPLGQLDLTDAQREQIRGIVTARGGELETLHAKLRTARDAQHAAVTRVPVDENEVRARVAETSAVEADLAVIRARLHEQIYQVLTPEQQQKAEALRAERAKRRADRLERAKQRNEQRRQQRQSQPKQL